MTNANFMVFAYAHPGTEAEFTRWYADQHIPDLLRVPGLVSATRYDVSVVKLPDGIDPPTSLVIYGLEGNPATILAEMGGRMGGPEMPTTAALDSSRTIAFMTFKKGERRTA